MKVKEFIKVIRKLPKECVISTGNATGCFNNKFLKDETLLNFYYDFSEEELKKDFSKIKELIIWGEE